MDKVFFFLQLLSLSCSVAVDVADLSAFVGGDCVLPCSAPQGEVLVLEWTFSGKHLLFYRSGKILKNQQDVRFRERAELKDPTVKSVDVTLRNVRDDDNGTYVCEGLVQTPEGRERFTRTVQLHVSHEAPEIKPEVQKVRSLLLDENPEKQTSDKDAPTSRLGLLIGIPLFAVTLTCVIVIGLVHFKRKQIKREKSSPSNAAAEPEKSDTSEPPSPTDSLSPLVRHA